MRKKLLYGMVTAVAMLMGVTPLSAAEAPEHLYIVGDASPSLWNIDIAHEMVSDGAGNFSYEGPLYMQKLRFITDRNWGAACWVPEVSGWGFTDASTATMVSLVNPDNFFWVGECGKYRINVSFSDAGCKVDAAKVGDLPPMAVLLGAASNEWDCLYPHPCANIYPAPDTPDIFQWECVLLPNDSHKHFKFISYPSNPWATYFYVPVDADTSTKVKMIEPGKTYQMQKLYGNSNPAHDHFWGVADEYCDGSNYRATLDVGNQTFRIDKVAAAVPPAIPVTSAIHNKKAPLYWSVYEYAREMERQGIPYGDMDLTSDQWNAVIDMMATNFKDYGYDMICTDGFLPQTTSDGSGYMSHYGSMALTDLVSRAKAKGLRVGVYDNPLWIKGDLNTKIPGTPYIFRNLVRNSKDVVLYPEVTDRQDFGYWVVTDHPGAREYIDGWFKHYRDMGVDFVRMDFMCWYEDADPGRTEKVTCGYGRERYERGLAYICEAAEKYGIFTSIVMPELYNDAELESKYCHMTRIVRDTDTGGWDHFSSANRGVTYNRWPYADNQMDGFTYWSHIGGRDKVILDGDFLRLNKCDTDDERRSQVSLQLMAGGPVAIADTPETIGNNAGFYTNEELLSLRADGFVGKPLSDEVNSDGSCVWWGKLSNDNVVVAFFNRDDASKNMGIDLNGINLKSKYFVRDLWSHTDEGTVEGSYNATVPGHGCKVVKLNMTSPEHLYIVGEASPSLWNIDIAQEMVSDGNGNFSYEGPLYKQKLQFITGRNWDAVRWVPQISSWGIVDAKTATMVGLVNSENFFWVGECGKYRINVSFTESGCKVDAAKIGDLPTMVVLMGAASNQWDCRYPHPSANIYPAEETPDLLVWEGTLMPNEGHKHFKYISYPCNAWETYFYVPADADTSTGVKMVEPGKTYDMQRLWGNQNPAHDHFWGVADEYCDNATKYRATLDLKNNTFSFVNAETPSSVEAISAADDSDDSEAEYYNLQGVRVTNPQKGIYIRKTADKVTKVVL